MGRTARWPPVADEAPADLRALHLADSVAVDPHKWLYAPLEAGCVLVRAIPTLLREPSPIIRLLPLRRGGAQLRGSRSAELARLPRAEGVARTAQAGRAGYGSMIGDDIRLSRRLHAARHDHPELEAYTQSLSINTFRFVPASLHATRRDALTLPRTSTS
jgi:aromatic-L-amino-acid/L-tryptophan decarboxylase